ncbi:MAG TPA: Rrf2 family transcriptional regulator, partial [Pseudomonadales bacterium]|nr:Rrf2 family transcriptional regulator [Pseudomonadales bacterium]
RDATLISVAQIIDAVNESVDATSCGGEGDCQQGEKCLTHDLWCLLSEKIHDFLAAITLAGLVSSQGVQDVSARQQRQSNEERPVTVLSAHASV